MIGFGLAVHGVEYAFGAHEYPTTGIFEGEPKQCDGFTFRKSILIGWTEMTPGQVRVVMEELAEKYKGNAYNLITKNCNHFCNDACIKLTGIPIPRWVNRLARIGKYSLIHSFFPSSLITLSLLLIRSPFSIENDTESSLKSLGKLVGIVFRCFFLLVVMVHN